MSYDHTTVGFESYETFILSLKTLGIPYVEESKSEGYVRGWDGNCMCYCGYDIHGLDLERVLKHMEGTVGRPPIATPDALEILRSYLELDEALAKDFIKMGFKETCPCCTGTCGHRQSLRICRFTTPDGQNMVAEEYLAVEDHDCDGQSRVAIEVYPEGKRPDLESRVQVFEA